MLFQNLDASALGGSGLGVLSEIGKPHTYGWQLGSSYAHHRCLHLQGIAWRLCKGLSCARGEAMADEEDVVAVELLDPSGAKLKSDKRAPTQPMRAFLN